MALLDSKIADMRVNYHRGELIEDSVSNNPFEQFGHWLDDAKKAAVQGLLVEPNVMTVCTALVCKGEDGSVRAYPSARLVLLKDFDETGFVFYTNYNSRKSQEIKSNPYVALVFYWERLERQVRIEGEVVMVPEEQSTAYFQSRPKGSQQGAWASPCQSSAVASRHEIEKTLEEVQEKFKNVDVLPKPEFWGGWKVIPTAFEFWQGRANRLHDRLSFKMKDGEWVLHRLSP